MKDVSSLENTYYWYRSGESDFGVNQIVRFKPVNTRRINCIMNNGSSAVILYGICVLSGPWAEISIEDEEFQILTEQLKEKVQVIVSDEVC